MIEVLSCDNMRRSDAAVIAAGTPETDLVWRAAQAVAQAVAWQAPVAIVCGKGNNGADGLALACILRSKGLDCTAYSVVMGPMSEARRHYYLRCMREGVDLRVWAGEPLSGYATVVDCLFGTGFRGVPKGPAASAIKAINQSGAYVVSVDVNSGLDADSGMAEQCVRSSLTLSLGGYKTGHFLNMAPDVIRSLRNLDIGIPPAEPPYGLVEPKDLAPLVAPRAHFANKGTYGYVALVGGSLPYSGAPRLAAMAAASMRAGAGVVKLAVPQGLCPLLVPDILECTLFPLAEKDGFVAFDEAQFDALTRGVKSLAFGMGIGTGEEVQRALAYLWSHYEGRLVVDADGLTALARLAPAQSPRGQLVLTPHVKEMARLMGCTVLEVLSNFVETARQCARRYGAVVLLKGPTTVVTDGQSVRLVAAGAPGMATAGSGDVLSGILAATTAYVADAMDAVCLGAYLNGRAGELAQALAGDVSMVASDTVRHIAPAVLELKQLAE